jgi:hypothetical protein
MTSNDSAASNRRATLFLELAILGLLGQLIVLGVFLAEYGLDFGAMGDQLVASPMATLGLLDLAFSALAFLVWMPREAKRVGIETWWPYAAATLGGLCFAFPLFLSARERARA